MRAKFCARSALLSCVVCILTLSNLLHISPSEASDLANDQRYREGKEQYEALQKESRMPRYSECWLNSLQEVEAGCKLLTDDLQHRLALRFTNCFLMKTGRDTYPCDPSQDLEECTKHMKSEAYNTYTEFFTHTQNICFFLQSQVWQQETENTVHKLSDNSAKVAQQIADSSTLQEEMMKQQNQSISNQQTLLERGNELKKTLEDSTVDVHHMLHQFKESTVEQRQLIFEVFDKVNSLQSVVMGEFTGFYSLIFYAISMLICHLLTATPRTSGARFWLFLLMTLNMAAEQLVCNMTSADIASTIDEHGMLIDGNTVVYGRMWLCRKVFTALGVMLVAYFAYSYTDLMKANNQLLMDITRQNSELKHLLECNQSPGRLNGITEHLMPISRPLPHLPVQPALDTTVENINNSLVPADYSVEHVSHTSFSSTGYGTDSEYSDSGESDRTFRIDDGSDSDADSFMTTESGRWSRGSTPTLMDELRDLRKATPLREMTPQSGGLDSEGFLTPQTPADGSSAPRKRGRPLGSKTTPKTPPEARSPGTSRYNLRSRRGVQPAFANPVVESESAHDFKRVIKHLASVAMRNSMKTRITLERRRETEGPTGGAPFFSSDED